MESPRPRPGALDAPPAPVNVGVAAPLGRDGPLVADRLRAAGLRALAYPGLGELCDALEAGHLGAVVVTAEVARDPAAARLRHVIGAQPGWSDVPVLVLGTPGRGEGQVRMLAALGVRPSATVLERPVPSSALVAATRLALIARQRQVDVRDVLEELEHEKAQLEVRVEARTREVRRLAADLTVAEQTERRRVAYLLHDDLQQRLHGLSITLALLGNAAAAGDAGKAVQFLERAESTLSGAASLTRSLSHDLAPPLLKGGGVGELLDWVTERAHERYGLRVDVEVDDDLAVEQEAVRVLLSQILGELLFNAAKYAGVDRVRVAAHDVPADAVVRFVVEDEGAGFDPSSGAGGIGLTSSRERAELIGGRVVVESAPGAGTRVVVEVPSGAAPDAPVLDRAAAGGAGDGARRPTAGLT